MTTTHTTPNNPHDVYVGKIDGNQPHSKWANPYLLPWRGGVDERMLALDLAMQQLRYAAHLQRTKLYKNGLNALRGRVLGVPGDEGHGDILVALCDADRPQRELQIIIAQLVNRIFNNMPHDPTVDTPAPQARVAVSGSRHMMCDGKLTKMIEKGDAYKEHYAQYDDHRALVQDAMHRLPVRYLELHHGACYIGGADDIARKVVQTWPTKIIAHPPEDTKPASFNKRNHEMIHAAQGFVAFWDGKVEKSGTRNFIGHAWPDEDWCIWIRYVDDELIDQVYCGLRFSFIEEVLRG